MKTAAKILPLLALMAMLTSCRTYFTEPIRKMVQQEDVKRIEKLQFYIDREIVIEYKTAEANDKIEGGKLKFESGFYYYTIVFPRNTKAQAVHYDNERLKVFFEAGEDRFLVFGDNGTDRDQFYQLYGNRKDGEFWVDFEGKSFRVVTGSEALLKIQKNYKQYTRTERRTVKGVEVK